MPPLERIQATTEAMELVERFEILRGEGLKTAAELTITGLSKFALGEKTIERYAFGAVGRIEDPRLHTTVAGIEFENPVMVGAGWDKKGRAVRGLYDLGFSGVEVGTVPLLGQPGNPKPRLWSMGNNHGVGLNRLGFNSPGSEAVDSYLKAGTPFPCPVGINVGKNKLMSDDYSPWAHAEVVKLLYPHATYFVFNPSSPNTPDLTLLQKRAPLKAHLGAMQEAMVEGGGAKPLFAKISPDITVGQLEDIVDVAVEMGIAGIIVCNTTISDAIKRKHNRAGEAGGISGNDWEYRFVAQAMATAVYDMAGDKLEVIGVGAISNAEHALERMIGGASLLQVVTGIREHYGKVAVDINRGILDWMQRHKYNNVTEIIGIGTKRGPKYPKAA